jgi:hypothetical protein
VKRLLTIDEFPEFFAGPKADGLALFNGNGISGSRITAPSGRFVAHGKGAEMNKFNRLSFDHGLFHAIEKSVDDERTVALGKTEFTRQRLGQFLPG